MTAATSLPECKRWPKTTFSSLIPLYSRNAPSSWINPRISLVRAICRHMVIITGRNDPSECSTGTFPLKICVHPDWEQGKTEPAFVPSFHSVSQSADQSTVVIGQIWVGNLQTPHHQRFSRSSVVSEPPKKDDDRCPSSEAVSTLEWRLHHRRAWMLPVRNELFPIYSRRAH